MGNSWSGRCQNLVVRKITLICCAALVVGAAGCGVTTQTGSSANNNGPTPTVGSGGSGSGSSGGSGSPSGGSGSGGSGSSGSGGSGSPSGGSGSGGSGSPSGGSGSGGAGSPSGGSGSGGSGSSGSGGSGSPSGGSGSGGSGGSGSGGSGGSGSPSPQFVYAAGGPSSQLSGIAIAQNGVSLVPGSPYSNASVLFLFFASSGFVYTQPPPAQQSPTTPQQTTDFTPWQINPASGALTQLPTAQLKGFSIAVVDPAAGYLYTNSANGVESEVYGYRINPQDGTLSALPGSPFPNENLNGLREVITQDGAWACFISGENPQGGGAPIACQQRDPSSGALSSNVVNGSQDSNYFTIDPIEGNYLLAMNSSDGLLDTLLVTHSGIQVTSETNIGSYSGQSIVPNTAGDRVAIGNGNGMVTLYQVDASTGTLTQLLAQQLAPGVGITFTPDGNFLVACAQTQSSQTQSQMEVYQIGQNALTPVGSPISVPACNFVTPALMTQQ